MSLSISGASQVQYDHESLYTVTIVLASGAYLSYTDTIAIAKVLSVNIFYNNNTWTGSPSVSVQQPGKVTFYLNESKTGTYSIEASFNGTVNGANATAKTSYSVQVVSFNPSQGSFGSWFSSFFGNPYVQGVLVTFIAAFVVYIITRLYRSFHPPTKEDAKDISNVAKGVLVAENMKKNGTKVKFSKKEARLINKDLGKGD